MNLSMKWLGDYVNVDDINASPRQYAEKMTMTGSKVEGYEFEGDGITNVVVGKILEIESHPDADKLVVCKIDVGSEVLQIVTGAKNIKEGDIVPVAKHNSIIGGGAKITKGKLRGVESCGMLCSVGELGLSDHDFPPNDNSGIMILDDSYTIGMDIREALGYNDTCVEFEITSNRPDCLSVIGLARETAASYDLNVTIPKPEVKEETGDISEYLSVDIMNKNLCMRYAAKIVTDVKIETSPLWMRERLRASGVRPINNLVDITNYVMLEYGQPMHAFDHKYVNGKKIVVRTAKEGEEITTLDGTVHALKEGMLTINDEKEPIGVAGVMGGEYSGIMDDTNTVVFESACFDGATVRRTAKGLGLRTESSARFEKGLDPNNCYDALMRACQLVEQLGAGKVVGGMIDIYDELPQRAAIKIDYDWVNGFLGTDIPADRCEEILKSLDFIIEGDTVYPPTYRADVVHKTDVAEEIARIYGYELIPSTILTGASTSVNSPLQMFKKSLSEKMLSQGLNEVITYSFISPKYYDKINLPEDKRESIIISNPLGEDTSVMRNNATASMLEVLSRNAASRNMSGNFFEIATEYIPQGENELPIETAQLMIGIYGDKADFYSLKGIIETAVDAMSLKNISYMPEKDNPTFHPGRTAEVLADGVKIGTIGEIHPVVSGNYKLAKAYVARISIDGLYSARSGEKLYEPVAKHPAMTRDLALVCDEDVLAATIEGIIKANAGKLLTELSLFDIYVGDQLEKGKKSLAYSLMFRAPDRTLTDVECDESVAKVLSALEKQQIVIRS